MRPAFTLPLRRGALALGLVLSLTGAAAAEQELATYFASSGSLPPEYAWDVTVTISDAGLVVLKHCTGYETEGPACKTRKGKASPAQVDAIRAAVRDSGLLQDPAQEAAPEEIPLGGASFGGTVTLDGTTVTLWAFPRAQDRDRVARVLATVEAAIPERLRRRFIEGN